MLILERTGTYPYCIYMHDEINGNLLTKKKRKKEDPQFQLVFPHLKESRLLYLLSRTEQ